MKGTQLLTQREQTALVATAGLGAFALLGNVLSEDTFLWPNYLVAAFFALSLALGGAVFLCIHHLSNAGWSAAIRKAPEAMMHYLPLGALSLLVTFFGRHSIYAWTRPETFHANAATTLKAAFLRIPFFYGRMIFVLALWVFLAALLRRESRLQDRDGRIEHTVRSKRYAAAFLAVFAVTFSLASFDWLMSIEPEFYSTIFAFYSFSGLFLSGIAALTVLVIFLRKRGLLAQITENHLHNLGKLLFAFSTFWAYIWLCQYLLIYYANLPEETIYYLRRTATPFWKSLFVVNILLNWLIPFVLLMPRKAKRSERMLIIVCALVLAGHWTDLYTMVAPVFGSVSMGSAGLAILVAFGFAAVFVLAFNRAMAGSPAMPPHDPYIDESLALRDYYPAETGLGWAKGAARALLLSTIAFGLTFAVWGLMGSLAPRFREMYHLTAVQTSLLIAVPVLLGSVGRIPLGILSDRFGGRIVMGVLLVFCVVPAFGATIAASYSALLIWGLLIGFSGASFSVGVAFTSKWFPENQQGTALGIYGIGNIGQSIAVFGAPALLAATGNWRVPFWLFGSLCLLFGLAFFLFARNAPVRPKPKKMREYFKVFVKEPMAWVLSLYYFLTFGGFVALGIYLPTLLKDIFGLAPTDAGARVAGFVVVATLMRPAGGWLADTLGGTQVLALVLGCLGVMAFGMTSSNMVIFTLGALGTASMLGLGNGAVFRLVPEFFPRETGTVTGLVGAAGGLGGFFPPLVLGVIRTRTGSYDLGFVFLSLFALTCLAVHYFVLVRRKHQGEVLEATD